MCAPFFWLAALAAFFGVAFARATCAPRTASIVFPHSFQAQHAVRWIVTIPPLLGYATQSNEQSPQLFRSPSRGLGRRTLYLPGCFEKSKPFNGNRRHPPSMSGLSDSGQGRPASDIEGIRCPDNRGRPHSSLGLEFQSQSRRTFPASDHRHKLPAGFRMTSRSVLTGLHHEYHLEKEVA